MTGPFHCGERLMQRATGEGDIAARNGRGVKNEIPVGAVSFLSQQQYCVFGRTSPDQDLWATFLVAAPGFAHTDESRRTLFLDLSAASDALIHSGPFHPGESLGVLFIELSTRRRLRVNGRISAIDQKKISLVVELAYPNCPKYIQRRDMVVVSRDTSRIQVEQGETLRPDMWSWISQSDTFFVASSYPNHSADVSHRGGKPGFVQIRNGTLLIPDYPGNSMFNTFGNLIVNPRAGLCFLDFIGNRQLLLTGDARVRLHVPDPEGLTGRTGRWWDFTPRRWVVSPLDCTLQWKLHDFSRFNP